MWQWLCGMTPLHVTNSDLLIKPSDDANTGHEIFYLNVIFETFEPDQNVIFKCFEDIYLLFNLNHLVSRPIRSYMLCAWWWKVHSLGQMWHLNVRCPIMWIVLWKDFVGASCKCLSWNQSWSVLRIGSFIILLLISSTTLPISSTICPFVVWRSYWGRGWRA